MGTGAWAISGIGAAVGLLGGLFGKGGSAVATPLLHLAGIPALAAVASPLPAAIPGTAVAAGTYARQRLIDRRVLRLTIACGVPATVAGALATAWIGGGPLIVATDVVVAGLGVRFLVAPVTAGGRRSPQGSRRLGERAPSTPAIVAVALTVGVVSGLLANTGGFLLAPLFAGLLGLPIKRALATSVAAAGVLAVPGTIVHVALGHVDWHVVWLFALASAPLSAVGAWMAVRARPAVLERGYGIVLATMGIALLAR
jgi:uncharacterized membrane protein YfcA